MLYKYIDGIMEKSLVFKDIYLELNISDYLEFNMFREQRLVFHALISRKKNNSQEIEKYYNPRYRKIGF